MKIGQYCQRQRCKHVELEQFFHAFTSRGFVSDSWAFLFHVINHLLLSTNCNINICFKHHWLNSSVLVAVWYGEGLFACSNLTSGCCVPMPPQRAIHPGSVNQSQWKLRVYHARDAQALYLCLVEYYRNGDQHCLTDSLRLGRTYLTFTSDKAEIGLTGHITVCQWACYNSVQKTTWLAFSLR